jgi:hypothetical protein
MNKHLLKPLLMVVLSVCLAGGLFATLSPVKTAHACGDGQSWIPGGLNLLSGGSVLATTHSCVYLQLIYQNDGNFVLYRKPNYPSSAGQTALWATGTENTSPGRAIFQIDGNLVVYDEFDHARWASNTNGQAATLLYLQGDGNLVIYSYSTAIWASNTCCQT